MWIEIESIDGPLTAARKSLATSVAREAFNWLSDVVRAIVIRVPSHGRAERAPTCSVVVVLRDGKRFDGLAVAENITDALERACHDVRRDIATAIGRPLRRRRGETRDLEIDRRELATGSEAL